MPKLFLLNHYHLTFEVSPSLKADELARARRAAHSSRLRKRLDEAFRSAVARFPSLAGVRVRLTD